MVSDVSATLIERGSRYGTFDAHAGCTQRLKQAMYQEPGYTKLSADQRESLDMIQHKIGRILCGDPDYADSWHDIAGYAMLVEQRLNKPKPPIPVPVWTPNVVKKEILFPEEPFTDTKMTYNEEILTQTFGNYGGSE